MTAVMRFQKMWLDHRKSILLTIGLLLSLLWLYLFPSVIRALLEVSVLGWNTSVVPLFGLPMATTKEAWGAVLLVGSIGGLYFVVGRTIRLFSRLLEYSTKPDMLA